jgi:TrmH family RNA methyltransferase
MGSIFWHTLISAKFSEFLKWVKTGGYKIYGTSAHAAQDYRQVDHFKRPFILLMGSERQGLTPSQLAVCDVMLRLPMHGRVTSLNLAIATGVMLYFISDKV